MGRIGISYNDVTRAITTLQSLNKNTTVDNIREVMGTGSKSTIARFLREWKAKHGLSSDDHSTLPSDLLSMVNGLWTAMREKVDNQSAEHKKEIDGKMTQLQKQLNQQKQGTSDLQQKIHKLEEQHHKKTEECNSLKAALALENQEKIQMIERASNLELRHKENREENTRLHKLLKNVQENLEHYQAATQQLRQEQSLQIEKQHNEFEQQLSQLRSQLESTSTEKSNYQAQCAQLNKSIDELEAEQKTLNLQYKEMQQKYTTLKAAFEKKEKDYEQLSKTHQQQSINLESKQYAVIELQLRIKSSDEKIASLEGDLSSAKNKIYNLRHENQVILQEKANLEGQFKQLQIGVRV